MENSTWALVVEDDAHSLIAITSLLTELHVSYKRNTSGKGIVQQACQMCPKLDFILLDTTLPNGDACAICRSIHSEPRLAHVPILALTDEPRANALERFRAAGFAGCLPKPLPRQHFAAYLQQILCGNSLWEEWV